MKKLIILFTSILLIGCTCSTETTSQSTASKKYNIAGYHYYEIEHEGHKYICHPPSGMFIHLESCPCKKVKQFDTIFNY